MPSKPKNFPPPRKSHTSTPIPGESETLAERLSYADAPRPFKNPHGFISKLTYRTASATTTQVRKSAKQILVLERERIGGGDGFLSAELTAARARGEKIEPGGKKKKGQGGGDGVNKRGHNLKQRGNKAALASGGVSGVSTPALESTRTSPEKEGEEDEDADEDMEAGVKVPVGQPGKEVFTYHTPTAPPSLLPNKKYCDITGLHANYTDPRTKLRYKGLDVYHVVRGLGPGGDQAYLALRGAQTHLK